jgi:hypothetical protein
VVAISPRSGLLPPAGAATAAWRDARPFEGRPGASRLFGGRRRAVCPRCLMRRIGGLLCFDLLQHRAADLLVRGEDRLAPEFDALGFGISPAARGRSKMRRRSSFAATPRMAKTISAKSEVVSRNGSASDRIPAPARCISRAITKGGSYRARGGQRQG